MAEDRRVAFMRWVVEYELTGRRGGQPFDFGPGERDRLEAAFEAGIRYIRPEEPEIVCLLGSTRFWEDFDRVGLDLSLQGKIVLSLGIHDHDDNVFRGYTPEAKAASLEVLGRLHFQKIDLAHAVYVINREGYVGQFTRREVYYAAKRNKRFYWLEPDHALTPVGELIPEAVFTT